MTVSKRDDELTKLREDEQGGRTQAHHVQSSQMRSTPGEVAKEASGTHAEGNSTEGQQLDEPKESKTSSTTQSNPHETAEDLSNGNDNDNNNLKQDVEKGTQEVAIEESDPNVVWWDGPDDPLNPLNFDKRAKVLNITLVSSICFITPLASSMFAPGVPELMKEFHSDNILLASFVVSVYVLGFAVGPLFFAPLSEIYGRVPVYHVCNFAFLAFNIASALATNLNMLIGFRFLAGVFGSAPLTNGGGTIADLVTAEKRGRAMSGFVMGPILGPVSEYHFHFEDSGLMFSSRPCSRRLSGTSKRLALGILGPQHAVRYLRYPQSYISARNIRCDDHPEEDLASAERDRKYGTAIEA